MMRPMLPGARPKLRFSHVTEAPAPGGTHEYALI
jgi:hypothetical protein